MIPCPGSTLRTKHRASRLALLLVIGAPGCTPRLVPEPGHLLLGTWSSPGASLTGTSSTAALVLPCVTVRFQALLLDASSQFQVTGTIARVTDPVPHHRGDPFPLSGQVVGDRVVLHYSSVLRDNKVDTLSPGRRDVSLCHP
jgi:hypothetical protein